MNYEFDTVCYSTMKWQIYNFRNEKLKKRKIKEFEVKKH